MSGLLEIAAPNNMLCYQPAKSDESLFSIMYMSKWSHDFIHLSTAYRNEELLAIGNGWNFKGVLLGGLRLEPLGSDS